MAEVERVEERGWQWVPFPRSRLINAFAAGAFGLVLRSLAPVSVAQAQFQIIDPDPPISDFIPNQNLIGALPGFENTQTLNGTGPCNCPRICKCCSGDTCCGTCHGHSYSVCSTGKRCWYTCTTNGNLYRCCDWHEIVNGDHRSCCCYQGYGRC